eukprot:TRINITY_DN57364_c0_g1_i1.p1 TRINITY_DN57364_c0_g1~~TRINITY_DN57364_c0_g1_i1.p1  ORF type:complete len:254 (-),score=50.76 TRINITY_DN57364_c0_g1_i1:178-888(-)
MGQFCSRRNASVPLASAAAEDDLTRPVLVSHSADVSEEDQQALYEYSRQGKLADVRSLLEQGVQPDAFMAYDGGTALTIAARSGRGDVVKLLAGSRADLSVRTDDGSTALLHAVSGVRESAAGALQAVKVLLAARADASEVNDDDVSPLILASSNGALELVRLLVASRADVHAAAEEWGTALDAAEEASHTDVAAFLVTQGVQRSQDKVSNDSGIVKNVTAGEKYGYGAFDGEASC